MVLVLVQSDQRSSETHVSTRHLRMSKFALRRIVLSRPRIRERQPTTERHGYTTNGHLKTLAFSISHLC